MTPEIPFSFFAQHDDIHGGWLAVFTYHHEGIQHVAYVRTESGCPQRFAEGDKRKAEHAAAAALVHALNGNVRRPQSQQKKARLDRKTRLMREANKQFFKELA